MTHTIGSVTAGDPYKIRIVARNRLGPSPASSETTIYAAAVPSEPNAPTRVANSFAQTTIDIEWTPSSNGGSTITGYEVWWNGGGSGPVTGLKLTINDASTTAQITGLAPGTYYKFAIKALNIVGSSGLSGETLLIAATVPAKPTAITLVS